MSLIRKASVTDAPQFAEMVGELLHEIMIVCGIHAFHFNLEETTKRLSDFIEQ